ncbi:MAG: hypothetical protein WCW17_00015 [Patescibacteria group bacterium]|jgi:hypothetical protein
MSVRVERNGQICHLKGDARKHYTRLAESDSPLVHAALDEMVNKHARNSRQKPKKKASRSPTTARKSSRPR